MARRVRVEHPGAVYHVVSRGAGVGSCGREGEGVGEPGRGSQGETGAGLVVVGTPLCGALIAFAATESADGRSGVEKD